MQLDQTRIPIRERSYMELLDLALHVVRRHPLPLAFFTALGVAPFYVLNWWLLREWEPRDITSSSVFAGDVTTYLLWMMVLIVFELPLASVFATRYLGLAMFEDRPSIRQVFGDVAGSLPQLILVQMIFRGLLTIGLVTWLVLFWSWPYLNEIILLERNPLFRGRGRPISTFSRCANLHSHSAGELLSRWMMSMLVGVPWICLLFVAVIAVKATITSKLDMSASIWVFYLPVVIWVIIGYFNVVRYLGYLDLRIRREGWEVELRMRAEGTRLRQEMEF